jgi:AcrR family transcriptional regulator
MLDVAEQLIARYGYGGVAVEDVTDAVGVKKPDLYNHFRDKRELYVAVRRRVLDRLEAGLASAICTHGPPDLRLSAAAEALLRQPAFLGALRQRAAETFLPEESRDFLFARAYGVLYRPITGLLRSAGAPEAEIPFLFDALVALAAHFGPLTPNEDIPAVSTRIAGLILPRLPGHDA